MASTPTPTPTPTLYNSLAFVILDNCPFRNSSLFVSIPARGCPPSSPPHSQSDPTPAPHTRPTPSKVTFARESTEQRCNRQLGHHNAGMAKSLLPHRGHFVEEDYIDMDITSAAFLYYTISSPPHSREFEFQMSTNPRDRETTTFPADELFYKGKLLPLHLPPRLQMVRKLLQSSTTPPPHHHGKPTDAAFDEKIIATTPSAAAAATTASTPSCSISPAASCCYVSGEKNSENSFLECSARLVRSDPNKSWSKRLKLIRQSSLALKLKASRAYLNSFFTRSSCSDDESCAVPQAKECSNGYAKPGKKKPFGQMQRERYLAADNGRDTLMRSMDGEKQREAEWSHRKSFSGIIKWSSTTKSSSASSSCSSSFSNASSNGYYQSQILKRSSSVNSEVESSIQGAIAYCKKSQQLVCARKSASAVGYCSPGIAAACENQEKLGPLQG